ncbi:MAG: hypothetical protein O3A80_00800, partial [bacterium]|nr:hypothetical protein [bacterium]
MTTRGGFDRANVERRIARLTEEGIGQEDIQALLHNKEGPNLLDRIVEITEEYKDAYRIGIESADTEKLGADAEDAAAKALHLPTVDELIDIAERIENFRQEIVQRLYISTETLLNMQSNKVIERIGNITIVDDVHTPPDDWRRPDGDGSGTEWNTEFSERLAALRYILYRLNIDPNSQKEVVMQIGRVHDEMMRRVSYVSVFIRPLNLLVELCNQIGNKTFVWRSDTVDDIGKYADMGKDEKKALLDERDDIGWQVVMSEGWMERLEAILTQKDGTERLAAPKPNNPPHEPRILRDMWEKEVTILSFTERVAELKKFREDYPNKWPRAGGKTKKEKSLRQWLNRMRIKLRDNNEFAKGEGRVLLDMGVEAAEETISFTERVAELKEFRVQNPDRWPNQKAKNKEEKSLGQWLNNKRIKLRDNKEFAKGEEKVLLDMGVEAAEKHLSFDERVTELKEFRVQNPDRWPHAGGKNKEEKSLGQWLKNKRIKLRDNKEFAKGKGQVLLDMDVEAAEKTISFTERVTELKEFLGENPNKWPNQMAKNKEEKNLGQWLNSMRIK